MKKVALKWIDQAEADLLAIRNTIAKDQPLNAGRFVRRRRKSVGRLRSFPQAGWMVEELNEPEIREIVYGNYRVVYHYNGRRVVVLSVMHAARLPHWDYILNLLDKP
jgi:toxin ParE1/3/4